MRPAGLDKWLGIAGVVLILGATLVASRDYEASSTTRRARRPDACSELGLPTSKRCSVIAATAAGTIGVVAAWSR